MKKTVFAALLGTFFAAAPAHALVLVSSDLNDNVQANLDLAGGVALDLDLNSFAPSNFIFQVEAGDAGTQIAFNSIISNLIGESINKLTLELDGTTFASAGSIAATFGAVMSSGLINSNTGFSAQFLPGENFAVSLGSVVAGGTDFFIEAGNLIAGQQFKLTVSAVPEPATLSLMGLGLAAFVTLRRRRA